MKDATTPTCYQGSRVDVSVRYQKCFTFRFPHRKLLVISFAMYTIYMIFILYMLQIYLMAIVIYLYIMISGTPISECFGKKLRETLFTKSMSVYRRRYDRIQRSALSIICQLNIPNMALSCLQYAILLTAIVYDLKFTPVGMQC